MILFDRFQPYPTALRELEQRAKERIGQGPPPLGAERLYLKRTISAAIEELKPLAARALAHLPDRIEANSFGDIAKVSSGLVPSAPFATELAREHIASNAVSELLSEVPGAALPQGRLVTPEKEKAIERQYQVIRGLLKNLPADQERLASVLADFIVVDDILLPQALDAIKNLSGILAKISSLSMAGPGVTQHLKRLEAPAILLLAFMKASAPEDEYPLEMNDPGLAVLEAGFGVPDLKQLPHLVGALRYNLTVRTPWLEQAEGHLDAAFASMNDALAKTPPDLSTALQLGSALGCASRVLANGDPHVKAKLDRHIQSLLANPASSGASGARIDQPPPATDHGMVDWVRSSLGPVWQPPAAEIDAAANHFLGHFLVANALLNRIDPATAAPDDLSLARGMVELVGSNVLAMKNAHYWDDAVTCSFPGFVDIQVRPNGDGLELQLRGSGRVDLESAYPVTHLTVLLDGKRAHVELDQSLGWPSKPELGTECDRHPEIMAGLKRGLTELIASYRAPDGEEYFRGVRVGSRSPAAARPTDLRAAMDSAIKGVLSAKLETEPAVAFARATAILDSPRGEAIAALMILTKQLIQPGPDSILSDTKIMTLHSQAVNGLRNAVVAMLQRAAIDVAALEKGQLDQGLGMIASGSTWLAEQVVTMFKTACKICDPLIEGNLQKVSVGYQQDMAFELKRQGLELARTGAYEAPSVLELLGLITPS